ncbi:MAG: phosphomannose isomerase type II C-terminal cupin domain [Candidatus Aminicenantes bacterium]|nr:phosphomannose isomerase type II C-terminal cupin domain [Candidatus Aminicenantes bacterium]
MITYKEKRPWGWFEILHEESGLKIKRIMVEPGKRLSLQSHEKRSENWTIIKGRAIVTLDDREHNLSINQMIFIPRRARHRIENSGSSEMIFVEIQTGTYLGEDDLVRYQDDFNRI